MFDYEKELARYFRSIGGDGLKCSAVKCETCMFDNECDSNGDATYAVLLVAVGKAYEKLKMWSIDHPQKTMLQDLLEKYPNIKLNKNGAPIDICPSDLGLETLKECIYDYE